MTRLNTDYPDLSDIADEIERAQRAPFNMIDYAEKLLRANAGVQAPAASRGARVPVDPPTRHGFYVESRARLVGADYVTEWDVCFILPYRTGCRIAQCASQEQAHDLAAALQAVMHQFGRL